MATAEPSQTAAPFIAPNRSESTLQPPHGPTTPTSVLPCLDISGTLRPETIASPVLEGTYGFFVYLPPCYDKDRQAKYPLLFLFHGLGRTPDQWLDLGLTQTADSQILTGAIPPMIIVLPYILGGDSNDAAFLADLLPAVDDNFRTIPDRSHRFIGGISRGAEWALRLGVRRADLFSKVGLHSIALSDGALGELHTWGLAVPESLRPEIYLDGGYEDPLLMQMNELTKVLDALSWPYEKHVYPGDHSDEYWRRNLKEYLLFYGKSK